MASNSSCYCCAYGGLHALPIITGAFAFLCTVNASITCDYLRVYFHDTPDGLGIGLGIGLWTVEDLQADGTHYPCKAYPDEIEVDGKLRFARAMDRLSTIVGAVILLLICIPACMKFDAKMYFKRVAYICFALSMTTMLTLTIMAADVCQNYGKCTFQSEGGSSILASLLWLVAGGGTVFLKERRQAQEENTPSDSVNHPTIEPALSSVDGAEPLAHPKPYV